MEVSLFLGEPKMECTVKKLANDFRNAIEKAKKDNAFLTNIYVGCFCGFPYGCCDEASNLLSRFLLENNITSNLIRGVYKSDKDCDYIHVWLMVNDIVVDITGDQFEEEHEFFNYNKTVYVGPKDNFHKLFTTEIVIKLEAIKDWFLCNENEMTIHMLYDIIMKYM